MNYQSTRLNERVIGEAFTFRNFRDAVARPMLEKWQMKWVFWTFLGLYVLASVLLLIGNFGWFGQDEDPLSAVFLIPLGLPWNIVADRLGLVSIWTALLAPAINLGIIFWFWKRHAG